MNYILYSILFSIIFILIIKKDKNNLIMFLLVLLLMLTIVYPEISINATKQGINLWLYIIVPSLLPFFIINDTLSALSFPETISNIFYKSSYLIFNTSGYGVYAFIMSIFSGYPTGAKIVSELLKDKKISTNEGQQILTFSSTSGPLFIIGAVGTGMLSNPKAGYILLFSHILGAFINGLIYRHIISNKEQHRNILLSTHRNDTISKIFYNSILSSLKTCGIIGGYIIIFSLIIAIIDKTEFIIMILNIIIPNSTCNKSLVISNISNYIKSILELSNGCKLITSMSISLNLKMCILSFLISFGGISIIFQVYSLLSNTNIDTKLYFISKFSQGIITTFICYILINIYPSYINCANIYNYSIYKNPYINIIILLCLLIILSIYALTKIQSNNK